MFLFTRPLTEFIWPRFADTKIVEYRVSGLRPSEKPSEGFALNWQTYWIFKMVFFSSCNFLKQNY